MCSVKNMVVNNRGFHRRWVVVAGGLLLVVLFHLIAMAVGITPDFTGNNWYVNWDTDSYSRVLRVMRLYETGVWYDPVAPYYNAPYGLEMHWTRSFDILLFAGAWVGSFFTDFKTALEIWAMILSGPLIHFLFIPLLYWITRTFTQGAGFVLVVLMFLSLSVVSVIHLAGFIDYHGLLVLIVLAAMAPLIKGRHPDARPGVFIALGILAGFAVWTTIESLMLIFPSVLAMALFWVWRQENWLQKMSTFCYVFLISLSVSLWIERPPNEWFRVEYDRLSILQVLIALTLLFIVVFLQQFERKLHLSYWWQRLLAGALIAGVALVVLLYYFPPLTGHPQQDLGKIAERMLDGQVGEHPYISNPSLTFALVAKELGPLLIILPYIIFVLVNEEEGDKRDRFVVYCVFLTFFILYALLRGRAIVFLQISMLLPWFEAVQAVGVALSKRQTKKFHALNPRLKMFLKVGVLALVFVHYVPAVIANIYQTDETLISESFCDYDKLIPYLQGPGENHRDSTILAPLFVGPELVYRTSFSVIASPYHRNRRGIDEGFFMAWSDSHNPDVAGIAQQRAVAYVLVCRRYLMSRNAWIEQNTDALYTRLLRDNPPGWLSKVDLPDELEQQFILYQRVK